MKKIATIAIIFLLIFCGCADHITEEPMPTGGSVQTAFHKEPSVPAAWSGLQYGRDFLSPEEQTVYDQLYRACEQFDITTAIGLPPTVDAERFAVLARYFIGDNPRFYWVEPVLSPVPGEHVITLSLRGQLEIDEVRRRDKEIEQAATAMLDGVPQSAAECAFAVHDRLVERVNYDGGNLRYDSENIYGALVKRYAVCEGYAQAFQFLMQRRGIDCAYFKGSNARGTPHAWNAIRLDGEWYYVDVTWDATDPWRRKTYHNYLGITLEELNRSHLFAAGQYPALPVADSRTYNYYYYSGYALEPVAGREVKQLAEVFTNRLEAAVIPEERERVFLDIKIFADQEEYLRVKELFIKELYAILREMEHLAEQRGLAVDIDTGGEVRCNFSDEQQVLILLPGVGQKKQG